MGRGFSLYDFCSRLGEFLFWGCERNGFARELESQFEGTEGQLRGLSILFTFSRIFLVGIF